MRKGFIAVIIILIIILLSMILSGDSIQGQGLVFTI